MNNDPAKRFWEIFFEIYEHLPRQGPGSRASAARALGLCSTLPASPEVLDLGCGVGGQTLHLAELTAGTVVAVDSHKPRIERLQHEIVERGLADRIRPIVGDIGIPDYPPQSFDLIWSEGALYFIGIENALRIYHQPLRPGGYFAFTDAVWRKENPPSNVKESFAEYPGMGWVRDLLAIIEASPLTLVDHFTLPDEDWWNDFYNPMERRIADLRAKYTGDTEALTVLDQIAAEPEMHRNHADYFAYEFFVVRKD